MLVDSRPRRSVTFAAVPPDSLDSLNEAMVVIKKYSNLIGQRWPTTSVPDLSQHGPTVSDSRPCRSHRGGQGSRATSSWPMHHITVSGSLSYPVAVFRSSSGPRKPSRAGSGSHFHRKSVTQPQGEAVRDSTR
jgi:hypothetical protein